MPVKKKGRVYNREAWRRIRSVILRRDGYRCRKCGARGIPIGGTARLSIQHKIPERVAPHLALEPSNLVTLCLQCHGREDGGRRYR